MPTEARRSDSSDNRTVWRQTVREFRKSGVSRRAFCDQSGFVRPVRLPKLARLALRCSTACSAGESPVVGGPLIAERASHRCSSLGRIVELQVRGGHCQSLRYSSWFSVSRAPPDVAEGFNDLRARLSLVHCGGPIEGGGDTGSRERGSAQEAL